MYIRLFLPLGFVCLVGLGDPLVRGQDKLLDLHRDMDEVPVDGVRQLEASLPLVLPE